MPCMTIWRSMLKGIKVKIWIDLDHTPHVPVFRPLLKELEKRGIEVVITARDFAQTVALLEMWNMGVVECGSKGVAGSGCRCDPCFDS